MRYAAILAAAIAVLHAPGFIAWRAERSSAPEGPRVILIVADGLRWQEVFRGADPSIPGSNGKYWRESVAERRAALMPFIWKSLAPQGGLLGNRDVGSNVVVTNPMKFSYPGYNEMLVGYPDARIDRNDFGPNPNVTVFEWLNERRDFEGRVSAFGMWDTFNDIFNVQRSELPVRDFQTDAETARAALAEMRTRKPRAMFVGFGATDDLAHKERYDLVLDAAHAIDGYVALFWREAQAIPEYRGRTTIILVADHGRGRTAKDWMHHNANVPGSDETCIAFLGPAVDGTGELRDAATLSQVAATVAGSVGLDYRSSVPRAARALNYVGAPVAAAALK